VIVPAVVNPGKVINALPPTAWPYTFAVKPDEAGSEVKFTINPEVVPSEVTDVITGASRAAIPMFTPVGEET
jgi:hypothetical protein